VAYAYAERNLGPEPTPLGPSIDRFPYGANFAVRTDAVGPRRFPEDRGRRWGAHARGGEEIAFIGSVLAGGHQGWWVPAAAVQHRIGPERQTTAYLREYSAADAMSDELDRGAGSGYRASHSRLLARWLVSEARYRLGRATAPPDVWIRHLLAAGDAWGRLQARSAQVRARRRGPFPIVGPP
jgi:hypothetical protein